MPVPYGEKKWRNKADDAFTYRMIGVGKSYILYYVSTKSNERNTVHFGLAGRLGSQEKIPLIRKSH